MKKPTLMGVRVDAEPAKAAADLIKVYRSNDENWREVAKHYDVDYATLFRWRQKLRVAGYET